MFDKSGLRYSFEKRHGGGFQVRLNGQFVCYNDTKDPEEIDELLEENGYMSRQHFYDESVEASIAKL